ncbi:hypothetical protein BDF19DRAFT_442833 [Syncephalis fuscata]|nr:hypothetical protein BDF19DRAFT_442833 [Syncephalis fuscata]
MRFLVLFVFTIFAAVVSALPVPSNPYGGNYRSNMLSVINNDREARNLNAATLSNCLNAVAAQHSQQLREESGTAEFSDGKSLNDNTDLSCKDSLGEITVRDVTLSLTESEIMQYWISNNSVNSLLTSENAQVGFGVNENAFGRQYWTIAFTN